MIDRIESRPNIKWKEYKRENIFEDRKKKKQKKKERKKERKKDRTKERKAEYTGYIKQRDTNRKKTW